MGRVAVNLDLLRWARDRAGKDVEDLRSKFPQIDAWETSEVQPTLKQLERYARATRTPFGYFFLSQLSGNEALDAKTFRPSVLLDPFPYTNAQAIVGFYIHDVTASNPFGRAEFTPREFLTYEQENRVFDSAVGTKMSSTPRTRGWSTSTARTSPRISSRCWASRRSWAAP